MKEQGRIAATIPILVAILAVCLSLPARAGDELWLRLKSEPNMVVLMRHTHASGGNALAWDQSGACKGELVLSAKGKAHAKRIGARFAAHGIAPLSVSSPMCRCLQTAEIAFGGARIVDPELRQVADADAERVQAHNAKAQAILASHRGSTPIVFVSHRPNIDQLTMELLEDGDLLVGTINEAGEVEVQGKIVIAP
ncbi:MAG TPA: phosphoglycerate mutase family protein [Burkholderiaceae bacterium]|mgnify:CR=1 FL=1|nr:phosphoglycerate mutase family protein [Burkholderiaceae bacterium]